MADGAEIAGAGGQPGYAGAPLEAPAPVAPGERIVAIDVLRGFALLGILPMNILTAFALNSAVFFNPPVDGGVTGANRAVWLGTHIIFDMKMMSIFSMLFGAGLIVIAGRAEARGDSAAGLYYRRLGWLALIGLAHAYLLWFGDILFLYAACGMLLYPVRRLPPWALAGIGVAMLPIAVVFMHGLGALLEYGLSTDAEWADGMLAGFAPSEETVAEEAAARTGSYAALWAWNARAALEMHVTMLPTWAVWRITGLMLLGMALMKWGVLSGGRSVRFYACLAAAGYALGLPVVWLGAVRMEAAGFDAVYVFRYGAHYNYFGSVLVALGHIGAVMLAVRLGVLGAVGRGLAAVGRTALSNYLFQTFVCLGIFWGLGLFGRLDRVQLMGITVAIWGVQVAMSVLWLRAGFRFGPAEWVWRSLTYGRAQPLRAG